MQIDVEDFKAWLATKGDATFDYISNQSCCFAQYLQHLTGVGEAQICVLPHSFQTSFDGPSWEIPIQIEAALHAVDADYEQAADLIGEDGGTIWKFSEVLAKMPLPA
jgi:hypothetical protein